MYVIPSKSDNAAKTDLNYILKNADNLMSSDDHKMWMSTKRG